MRSTKIAPLSLSTSYFTGSASLGISMTTLISSGTLLPVGTWSRPMGVRFLRRGGEASGPAAGGGGLWGVVGAGGDGGVARGGGGAGRGGGGLGGGGRGGGGGGAGDFTPRGASLQHQRTSGTPQLGRLHTGAYTYCHVSASEPVHDSPA